jgi:hypothetical protein
MPVTFVRDPVTGITYSVNISGSTPTEQESARIDQFLASQRTLSVLPQAQPVEEEEIDRTAFGRGFVREPFQRERSFGVVEEALADTAFGKFFGFDAEEARAKQEAAEAELRRLELEDPSIRFEDITGLGTAASVSGEALGGEARDIAIQAGATATGAGIGGLFFGAGAAPGAAIGRTAGVAYTTAQAAPQMLAEAIEAQKEEGNEVNLTKALGATAINLLSEFVTDYFVIGKLIPKEAKSKVGSAVRSAIEAGTAEGATEVFQQAVIRGQAGQDLTSPEAIAEYAESLYSGMTVGGTIGGVGGFLSTPDRSAEKELDDDLKELREYGLAGFKFAEETEKDIEAQRNAALGAVGIDLDAPLQIGTDGAPLALPAPDAAEIAPKPVIADTEFENLSFNKAEYERVLQQVKADITRSKPQPAPQKAEVDVPSSKPQPAPQQAEVDVPSSETLSKPVSNPINIPAIHQRVKADIPGITVSKVRDIMKELQARGFVAENPASKKNKFIPMGSLTPEVKTPDVSYRRQIDSAADFIKADQTRLERLQYDLRSAEAYGRDLEGNRVTPNQVNATIARVEQRIAQRQQRIELANQRLQSLGQDTHVPRIEKVGIPPSLKAVPVAEGTPDALRPRFEAQQAGIRGMKEQVSSLNKQVRKLNEQAKKRTLSSNELDRMQKLQQQQAELSKRLGEAQANLKAPEKIVQEAKGEQFREQERQREIERKLAAARARAAADQVKAQEDQGVSPVTPAFNAKQTRVFDALKKRLSNLGLKDVKLEGVQKIEGGEGFFDPVTKTITLAMGMYDPNMNDQQLFDAISEVMNHEVIHALRAMGVLKPNEMKVLERLAEKTKYVKRTKDGTQKRNYTYLDRAKSLYSDYTPTQQKEEAIAEMFRDYIAGRLKLGGGPRSLFEKIKKFFKSLIGANVDNGFNSVEDIFQGIRRGEIGARDRVAPAAPATQPAAAPSAAPSQAMQSRLIATDNPGGSWLEGKRRNAEEAMRTADRKSYRSKGLGGSITAYMPKPANLPINILSSLTGVQGENRRVGDPQYDALAEDVSRRGFLPDQDGNAVVVGVNHLGQAYLLEGNTRVAVARDFGVPSVRAEVRWFNGGELADGPFSPSVVERLAASAPDPSSLAINEDTQRRLSVLRTKNRSTDLVRDIDELVRYAEEQSSWRDWYDRYQSVLSDLFGDSSDLFRSLLSATSQAASVPANVGLAIKAYDQMLSGQPFTGFLPAVIKNLNRIRADEALSGRKIGEYGRANEGDDQGIAIDRHIAMIMFDTVNPSAGQVEAGKAAIRAIAERLSWKPREVQAALWAANIKRTGKEPQSYDTFLIRKAEQIRAIRERFPTSIDRRDDQGAGAGRGAGVGATEDGQRFSIRRGAVSQPDTTVAGGLTSKGYIKVSDLERAMITPIFADLTSAGNVYDQLDGMAVAPTTYMGGPNFPWLKAYRDANVVWSFNDMGKITALRNKVLELRKLGLEQGGDGRVVVTVLAMKDDAHTSNEMSISSLINTLNAVVASGKFPRSQLDAAKKMIVNKAGKKDEGYSGLVSFPGFDDASALADWSRKASFTTRKALATEMQSAAFQSLEGMFPVSRVVREAVDPDYRATQQGDMLLAFEIDPNDPNLVIDFQKYHTRGDRKPYGRYKGADGKTYRVPRHPAYQFGLRGKLLGSFNTHIPMEIMYGDLLSSTYNRIPENLDREQEAAKKKADRAGEPFTPMTPEEREKAIAAKQRNWTPKFALERSRTTDGQLVTPQIVKEAEAVEGLHDYRVAQAMLAGIAGRWSSSDNTAVRGGIQPVEFERALAESEAAATLTKYTRADVQKGQKDSSLRVFQLGSIPVKDGGLNVWMGVQRGADYRDIYPSDLTDRLVAEGVLSDNEVALVGVANNELGVSGMTTFQVLKGIEEGVTVLDAFKVKSASKPYGLLPSIYGTLGFEEVGEIPFDPQYYTPQQIDDLKAVWSRQGWLEEDGMPSVSIMKWRGDDAARSEASKRFVLEGQDGLGIRGEPDVSQIDAEAASVLDGDVAGDQGDGVTGQGDGRANPRRFADRARDVSGRARDFVQNILRADDTAIKALKLPRDLIDKIKADYGQDRAAPERKAQQQRGRALANEVSADSRRMLSRLYSTTAPSQGTPQFGPSDLETAMQNMRYAGVQDKFASIFKKIGKPFKVDEKAIEDGTQWVVNKLQDNFVSVGKMYDALRKQGANIPRDMDAYFQELLLHGVTGAKKTNFKAEEFTPIVERVARLNVTDTERDALKRVSGYYDQILEKTGNKSHALTNAYLYALHALERNQRISDLSKGQITNGSGMSNQEAQNIIAFVNGMGAQRTGELRNIAAAVQGMISGTNDTYIEGGLIPDYKGDTDIDDETRKAFTKYKNYVPLRGFADPESNLDESAGGFSTTNRFGALGSPNKKALGRESYAGDILANVAVQRENAIDKAERNKVGVALLNLLESDVNTDAYAEVLLRHPLRRVMRNGRITIMPDRDFSNPNLPILAVRRGGEEILIGFKDPRLAAAFKGTSAKQMNAVMNGLHSFTRVYANLLTSWNPAFLLGNWPKDIETALFNAQQYDMEGSSKDIIKNVRPSFKAIMKVLNNKEGGDPYWLNRYKQFYDNGGQNVLNQMGDVVNNSKDIRDTISKIVAADDAGNRILTKTLWTSTKKGVGSLANYVEAVNSAVENSTRLAFFDAVVRNLEAQGVPTERAVREAAAAARQLTTNFGKGGEMKTAFNTFYLFFNASLQGSMAIFTSLVNNPKGRKLVAGVITAGFIMELLNGAISDDEDDDGIKDYDNLGDYVLSHNIILPDLNGDGTFNRVPLAYGINMFYNFGRVMGNIARGAMGDDGTYTPQEAAASTVGTVVESFNPFGGNNFWTFLAPTQLDLPVELLTNRNFMDGPIYKELSPFEQNKSRSALYWSTTSPSAIWTSKFINDTIGRGSDIIPGEVLGKRVDIQPDVIEHVIDFMLGGAGKFVLQMGEAATTFVPAAIMGDFERDMIRRTPILNKFITAVTEKDRSGDFYEKRDDVLVVYADLKDAIENGDTERALAIRERYAEYLPLIGPIRAISNEIKKLNKLRRNVNANANLSQERKREILDKIEERLAFFVSRGNQLMLSI